MPGAPLSSADLACRANHCCSRCRCAARLKPMSAGRTLRKELRWLRVGGIERYVERRRVAFPARGEREQQLVPAASEDAVFAVPQVALPLLCVRALRVDLVREGVVEVELGGKLVALLGLGAVADREVDVDGPALIPAWVDRCEPRGPVLVRHL